MPYDALRISSVTHGMLQPRTFSMRFSGGMPDARNLFALWIMNGAENRDVFLEWTLQIFCSKRACSEATWVASMAEDEELPSSVFVVEILVVILLSLAFETGQDKLRDYLKEHVRRENGLEPSVKIKWKIKYSCKWKLNIFQNEN